MNVFYNKEHVGDVLLVQLATEAIVKTEVERAGDIAILKEAQTGEIKAFNLFNASNYVQTESRGVVEVTPEFVVQLEAAIAKNGATISLDVDFSKIRGGLCRNKGKASKC